MKNLFYTFLLTVSFPMFARTVTLEPGQCVIIHGERVCSTPTNTTHVESVRVHTVTEERRTNYMCYCEYAIRESSGPMKGWWFTQKAIPEDNPSAVTVISEVNYGGDQNACQRAIRTNTLCTRR